MAASEEELERPGRPPLEVLTWFRLVRIFQQIDHASAEHLREWGLSVAQFDLLAQVGATEGLSQQDLARALLVTKGNVCQLVDRMERDGLIQRCQVGRTNRLHLTAAGRRLYERVVPAQEHLITRLFSFLAAEELAQLHGTLRKLDHALKGAESREGRAMTTEVEPKTITWSIDSAHSAANFSVKHMMFSTVRGTLGTVTGTIVEDTSDLTRSSVEASIDLAALSTRDEKRDAHLKSPDFFDHEQHPAVTFKSTRVEGSGDNFKVAGDLTIHGVTRPVTLNVTKTGTGTNPWGMQVAGFEATTTINRKDFGLNWNVALEAGGVLVGDTIKVEIEVEAVKQG
jgi:polyisoprenoid-binding protein YceI/DNA-binding MarR family transcriptional regulator